MALDTLKPLWNTIGFIESQSDRKHRQCRGGHMKMMMRHMAVISSHWAGKERQRSTNIVPINVPEECTTRNND